MFIELNFVFRYKQKSKCSNNNVPIHAKQNDFIDKYHKTKIIYITRYCNHT